MLKNRLRHWPIFVAAPVLGLGLLYIYEWQLHWNKRAALIIIAAVVLIAALTGVADRWLDRTDPPH